MPQYDITDKNFERLSEMLALDEGLFDGARRILGHSDGNLQKGTFEFNPETDIDGNETPDLKQELRKIQEAFNAPDDGTVRVMFLQWLVKSPEVRNNLAQLMASAQ